VLPESPTIETMLLFQKIPIDAWQLFEFQTGYYHDIDIEQVLLKQAAAAIQCG
jgi:hypothetical protein